LRSDEGAGGDDETAEERAPGNAAPSDVREALERARHHARLSAAEAARAARALLDAASLAATGAPSTTRRGMALAARALDDLAAALGDDAGGPLVGAIADALDAEISRWEQRAAEDPDARAVLRAWLGLREMLWELGVRRAPASKARPHGAPAARHAAGRPAGPRRRGSLQRVPLEG
jgi:hypothetical protein